MATSDTITVPTGSAQTAKWTNWLVALVGLWVAASPFVLGGQIGAGQTMLVTLAGGVVIAVLAGAGAYGIRATPGMPRISTAELVAWMVAVMGLWLALSTVVLGGAIAAGWPLYSTVATGALVVVLGAFAGYKVHTGPA
jgi:hypothetical protein